MIHSDLSVQTHVPVTVLKTVKRVLGTRKSVSSPKDVMIQQVTLPVLRLRTIKKEGFGS